MKGTGGTTYRPLELLVLMILEKRRPDKHIRNLH